MIIYIFFFLMVFLFTVLGAQIFGSNNIRTVIIPLLVMILFAGLRGNVGTDTFAYKTFFNSFGTDKDSNAAFEPLFVLYSYVINFIWPNDQFYIFIISVTSGVLLYFNLKLIEEKSLFLLFYLSTYFVMFNMNLMRFGMAILLISYPFLRHLRGEKSKVWLYFIGFLTHFTTLFTLFLIIKRKHAIKALLFFSIFFLVLGNFLLDKFLKYFLISLFSIGHFQLDYGLLLEMFILMLLFWINRRNINGSLVFLLFLYILLRNLSFVFDMLQRFAYIAGFLIYLHFFYKKRNLYTRGLVVFLISLNFYRTMMFIYNSDAAINNLIASYPGFSTLYSQTKWLPYKFFWEK